LFLGFSRVIGWKYGYSRVETKRYVGLWGVVTSFPWYVISILIDVHEYALPESDPAKDDALTTRHIIEETASLVSSWAGGVSNWFDEVNDEVAVIATAVGGIATLLGKAFSFVDFITWYDEQKYPPGLVEPPAHGLPPQDTDEHLKGEHQVHFRKHHRHGHHGRVVEHQKLLNGYR
jgi:hypothetical protein